MHKQAQVISNKQTSKKIQQTSKSKAESNSQVSKRAVKQGGNAITHTEGIRTCDNKATARGKCVIFPNVIILHQKRVSVDQRNPRCHSFVVLFTIIAEDGIWIADDLCLRRFQYQNFFVGKYALNRTSNDMISFVVRQHRMIWFVSSSDGWQHVADDVYFAVCVAEATK